MPGYTAFLRIDAMLEHAVTHTVRHAFGLSNLMAEQRPGL